VTLVGQRHDGLGHCSAPSGLRPGQFDSWSSTTKPTLVVDNFWPSR
jgi:hypothetical protein